MCIIVYHRLFFSASWFFLRFQPALAQTWLYTYPANAAIFTLNRGNRFKDESSRQGGPTPEPLVF